MSCRARNIFFAFFRPDRDNYVEIIDELVLSPQVMQVKQKFGETFQE